MSLIAGVLGGVSGWGRVSDSAGAFALDSASGRSENTGYGTDPACTQGSRGVFKEMPAASLANLRAGAVEMWSAHWSNRRPSGRQMRVKSGFRQFVGDLPTIWLRCGDWGSWGEFLVSSFWFLVTPVGQGIGIWGIGWRRGVRGEGGRKTQERQRSCLWRSWSFRIASRVKDGCGLSLYQASWDTELLSLTVKV